MRTPNRRPGITPRCGSVAAFGPVHRGCSGDAECPELAFAAASDGGISRASAVSLIDEMASIGKKTLDYFAE